MYDHTLAISNIFIFYYVLSIFQRFSRQICCNLKQQSPKYIQKSQNVYQDWGKNEHVSYPTVKSYCKELRMLCSRNIIFLCKQLL